VASSVAVSPGGGTVFVTGASKGATPVSDQSDYLTVAYNAATGAQLWTARYNGPANLSESARAVVVSPDGTTVFVTGTSNGGSGFGADYATVAYRASDGTQLWVARFNGPADDRDIAAALSVSRDGTKVFVTGSSRTNTSGWDFVTIAHSAAGTQLWAQRYNGTGNGDDVAPSVAASSGGKVYVTGTSWGASASGDDFATIAYNVRTGAQVWVRRYNSPATAGCCDHARALAARGGRVFVTGSVLAASGEDYATIAYNG
jgi:WD40 repeat protein